jgi:hypothetical protein
MNDPAPQRASRASGGRRAVQCLGGDGDCDLVGAKQRADGEEDDHKRLHRGCAHRAAARSPVSGRRLPAARGRLRGERRGRGQQDDATNRQGRASGPQRPDAERERRPEDIGQLEGRRFEGVRGADRAGIGHKGRKLGSQARADGRLGQPDAGCKREKDHDRGARRQNCDRDQQPGGNARARQQHRSLPTAVDELAKPRATDTERDRIDAGDDAGRRERAGHVLRVDQEADAEHRRRQSRDDRDDQQAPRAAR